MSTTGSKMIATTLIILSGYAGEAVLLAVRLLAALVLETITFGYRPTKIATMAEAMVTVVAAKAKPSRPSLTSQNAARTARMASSSIGLRKNVALCATWVQIANPMTAAVVNGAMRRARLRLRWYMSPVVFRDRNVAPCSAQTATRVTPVNTP